VRAFLVALVVLALAGVGGDRLAHRLATDEAEQRLAAEGFTGAEVDVGGFPFLTQLVSRRFDSVDVAAASVERDGLRAGDLTATATDVSAPSGGQVSAGRLTGEGTVSYDEVVDRLGVPGLRLEPGADGQVRLRREVTVLGRSLDVTAVGEVRAQGRRIRVVPTGIEVAGGGAVGADIRGLLVDELTVTYPLRDLPDGVSVDSITAARDGFVVRVTGEDVTFAAGL